MTRVIILCALLLGCAPMSESECRVSNWYARGEQDALTGSQPRLAGLHGGLGRRLLGVEQPRVAPRRDVAPRGPDRGPVRGRGSAA